MTTTSVDPGLQGEGFDKSPPPTKSVGAPGFAIYGGYVLSQEKDARLQGTARYKTYSNILANTTIVAAGVRFFLNLIARAGWSVVPADDSSEAQLIAEAVNKIRDDMATPWHRVVRRAAMFRFYGFSVQEWTAKRNDDGLVGFLDVESRPQRTIERWDTDESGVVLGAIQRSPQDFHESYLPRHKIVYLVDDSLDDNPEGMGLFRHLVSRATTLERYEVLEGWGFERDLRGTPIGRGPLAELQQMVNDGRLEQADVNALRAPVETFVQNALKGKDTGLMLDSAPWRGLGEQQTPIPTPQWSIELLRGATTSQPEMAKAIERINREMARVLGVEQLLLGADSTGSFALSRDKTQSFGLIVSGTLQEIKEGFERDFITPLGILNGWPKELLPSFAVEQIQYRDIEQVTGALRDMAQAGATLSPDDPAINEVRGILGLSDAIPLDIDLLFPQPPAPSGEDDDGGESEEEEEEEE